MALTGVALPAPGGAPTAVPGGGQALLPPPEKGPGSEGSVTLAGWFLIFLARFFSRAPDISGGVAEPLRSEGRRREAGGRCSPGTSTSPALTRGAASASTRGHPRPDTAHARSPAQPPRHYTSQKPPRAAVGGACAGWTLRGGSGGGAGWPEGRSLLQLQRRFQLWPRS